MVQKLEYNTMVFDFKLSFLCEGVDNITETIWNIIS